MSVSRSLLKRQMSSFSVEEEGTNKKQKVAVMDKLPVQGLLLSNPASNDLRLLDPAEALDELGLVEHSLTFDSKLQLSLNDPSKEISTDIIIQQLFVALTR